MQLSYCYRRGILSPRNREAEIQLRSWDIAHPVLVEFISLNNDADFDSLWDISVFQKINGLCDSMIDDYEEEIIEPDKLHLIVELIETEFQNVRSVSLQNFFEAFRELLLNAINNQKPVFFIL
ncbi:hypothetical protein Pan153_43620 [Gimesia panareensis]|uniref:Uncharacterized protein n=1 Tax=Gimesia panareensis TaxID=2527978 RepID=A0A518FTT2_9PLAN|nr:hypothetical protein [Gimesia panareensis]QDV19695.1 hypothetical protein Pan153_43620 [Gimesia panareensis]